MVTITELGVAYTARQGEKVEQISVHSTVHEAPVFIHIDPNLYRVDSRSIMVTPDVAIKLRDELLAAFPLEKYRA